MLFLVVANRFFFFQIHNQPWLLSQLQDLNLFVISTDGEIIHCDLTGQWRTSTLKTTAFLICFCQAIVICKILIDGWKEKPRASWLLASFDVGIKRVPSSQVGMAFKSGNKREDAVPLYVLSEVDDAMIFHLGLYQGCRNFSFSRPTQNLTLLLERFSYRCSSVSDLLSVCSH